MNSEWQTLTLGELGRIVTGKTPKTSDPKNFGAGIPFVTPTDMDGQKVIRSTGRYITEVGASTVRNSVIPAGSVMISCIGSDMGKSVIAGQKCVSNQQINSIIVDDRFHSEFIYYNLSMRKAELQHLASGGSTMPILNKRNFSDIKIDIPPYVEQRIIAGILSSLDDRVALLRETNATLEAIAQALFKSWFVDFDPVHAKQQGSAPEGMDEATTALFPDALIPWPTKKAAQLIIEGVLVIGDGYRAKNSELGFPGAAFVRAGDLTGGRIVPTRDYLKADSASKARGKTALAGDTVFTSKGTIGRFAFVDSGSGGAVYSPQVCFWRSLEDKALTPEFLHYWMKSSGFTRQVKAVQGQAAIMDFVSLTSQREMLVDIPPLALQKRFSQVSRILLERIAENQQSADTLISIRDTLLPRLISGQLRLPEAEALLEFA